MREYSLTLFCILSVTVLFAFIVKGVRLEKSCRAAMLVLISSVVIAPLGELTLGDIFIPISPGLGGEYADGEYIDEAKRAYEAGIERLVCEEFSLGAADVEVICFDFDFQSMRAARVSIFLSGSAMLADYKAIEERICSLGLGECKCVIG